MSSSSMPPPPLANHPPSSKKRKFDDVNRPSQILPPTGSTLYLALYAPPPCKPKSGGLLDYYWTFLLAPNAEPDTHGRQYLMREIGPNVDAGNGPGPTQASGTTSRGLSELALEQQRRRALRILAAPSQQSHHLAQHAQRASSAWELEIQDVPMWSTGSARIRIELSRVQDVEMFEALIKDVYLESDETKGVEWYRVSWMADAWAALVEVGHGVLLILPEGGGKSKEPEVTWQTVQETAMWFVEAVEREGRFKEDEGDPRGRVVPTWGLSERRVLAS